MDAFRLVQVKNAGHAKVSPEDFAATGSHLLSQYVELQRALNGVCEVTRLAELLRQAA